MSFKSIDITKIFVSRNDPDDLRLGDLIKASNLARADEAKLIIDNTPANDGTKSKTASTTNLTSETFSLVGYPDDEGIQLNSGRIGAAKAPNKIREYLFKMTPDSRQKLKPNLIDFGNLDIEQKSLEEKHRQVRTHIKRLHQNHSRIISLGGGHDFGFPDAAGFLDACLNENPSPVFVFNFDAHLDVRPTNKGFHSGTPFRRLLEEFGKSITFIEIGLQPQCNASAHKTWAEKQNAKLLWIDECDNLTKKIATLISTCIKQATLKKSKVKPLKSQKKNTLPQKPKCFVSLDIDVLTSKSAPGCSQSWDTGLESQIVFSALKTIYQLTDTRQLGIYEVSPDLDIDHRTSKLAAQFVYQFLYESGQ